MKLKTYLEKNKISCAAFARELGVSRVTVHKWVRGKTPIPFKRMSEIIRKTDCKVNFRYYDHVTASQAHGYHPPVLSDKTAARCPEMDSQNRVYNGEMK